MHSFALFVRVTATCSDTQHNQTIGRGMMFTGSVSRFLDLPHLTAFERVGRVSASVVDSALPKLR